MFKYDGKVVLLTVLVIILLTFSLVSLKAFSYSSNSSNSNFTALQLQLQQLNQTLQALLQKYNSFPNSSVPAWLDTGSNSWMLIAATLVGLQSVPGLMLYYAGLTKRKYAVNTMLMILYAFGAVLLAWTIAGFNFAFGKPMLEIGGYGILGTLSPAWDSMFISSQGAYGPSYTPLNIPMSTFIYFQFVFAAITPILFVGAIIERTNFKAWMAFVPLWSLLVYSPIAYWLFAGGWLNQLGAVDFSGGYVIHLNAGFSALAAAYMIGPRLATERRTETHNLGLVAAGIGLIWLGWNGFNGGDPYGSTIDAAIAILNTNIATATSMIVWMIMDIVFLKKPSLVGATSGAVTGLVAITPAAGYINGWEAILIGIASGSIPWLALYKLLPRIKVDDALGVFATHGIAGLVGGILTGVFANPEVTQYILPGLKGAIYGNIYQLEVQAIAALVVMAYSFAVTAGILKLISIFVPLRAPTPQLKVGDYEMHGEVMYSEVVVPTEKKGSSEEKNVEKRE